MSFNISGITAAHQPSHGSGAHEAPELPPFCLNDTQMQGILGSNSEIANNPVTGIANFGGNDCWANALIQSIASNPDMQGELRKMEALFSMSNEPNKVLATNHLRQAVQILIDERREGVQLSRINSYQIRLMLACIIGEAHVNTDPETQCDASEVYNKLIEIIESLYVANLAKCSGSDRGRFIQDFKPIFQTATTTVRNFQILEHLDGKEIRGEFFSSDQLWEFSERNPQHSDSLSVCYNCQMTKTEQTDTRLGLNAVEIKPLLIALVHKTDEIKKSGLPLEEKRRFVEERECAVFEQLMQSCFFQPEMDSGETWQFLDPVNRKLAKAKVLNTIKHADRAHENIFLCVTKREFNPDTLQLAKMTYRKECIGDYGSFRALKELPVPMLEKFTIPEEFLGEECSYELTSFIIHSGGEYGSGGHYTTFQKLGGIWYNCNDSVVKQASEWQLKEAIQLGYQFSYSKAPHVDPNALKVRAPISADEVLQRRQALQADLSTPFDFRSAQPQSQRQFKDSANSFSFDDSEMQILRDLKNLASTSSRSDDFQEYFVALPDSIRSFILDEIRQKVSSSASSVKKMQSKNHSEEGRKLLDKDLKLLSVVFHKNGGSFGGLDFSAHQGLVGIYDMLVANLYDEPLNLAEVHRLFYSPDFKPIREQIRAVVYRSAISDEINSLIEKSDLKYECGIIVGAFLENRESKGRQLGAAASEVNNGIKTEASRPVSERRDQGPFKAREAEMQKLIDVKNVLSKSKYTEDFQNYFITLPDDIRSLITDEIRQRVSSSASVREMESKNHYSEGRKLLDKDLRLLSTVFHKNGGSFGSLDFSAHEGLAGVYDSLVAQLFVEPLNLTEVHKLFYSSSFKSVREQIRAFVYRSSIDDEINRLVQQNLQQECGAAVETLLKARKGHIVSSESAAPQVKSGLEMLLDERSYHDASMMQMLSDVKSAASACRRSEDFQKFFDTLPDGIRFVILDEMRRKVSSSTSIKKMESKNHSEEGRKLLDSDFMLLFEVFRKNENSFGKLDFKGNKELADICDVLIANLHSEPLDIQEVRKLFYLSNFKPIRDQIREVVYRTAISDEVNKLMQQNLQKECFSALDVLLKARRKV